MDGTERTVVTIAGIIAALLFSVMGFNYHRDAQVLEAIKAGVDPIAATCAINGINGHNQLICQGKP